MPTPEPRRVYLDNNATTPLDPRVAEAMAPWLGPRWGNPSSIHGFGRTAREAVEKARGQVAALLGASPLELIFLGSGTEANNTVLHSLLTHRPGPAHWVVSAFEHPSIRNTVARLAAQGGEVTLVRPGPDGVVPAQAVLEAVRPETRLVALMLANNELGTLQPVTEVAAGCRELGVPVLCDAVQALGKVPVRVAELGVDYLTVAAHKFHGPLGAAALWVRPGSPFEPLLVGGGQERRRRASTENVLALVGFGQAAELAGRELGERRARLAALRDRFEAGLAAIPDVRIHCTEAPRLPQTSHVAFLGVEGESLLIRLDLAGFAVSTGSACSSGVVEPSKTLLAIGLAPHEALASLRISFGIENDEAEVDRFLAALAHEVATLREVAPVPVQ